MLAAKAQENTFFPSVLTEDAEWLSSQGGGRASGWAVCRMSLEQTGRPVRGLREGLWLGLGRAAVSPPGAGSVFMPPKEC